MISMLKQVNQSSPEYLIFYSDRRDVSDKEWHLEGAAGDQLTALITGLLPKVPYYFKIQARNAKGYGPLSSVVQFAPGRSSLLNCYNLLVLQAPRSRSQHCPR